MTMTTNANKSVQSQENIQEEKKEEVTEQKENPANMITIDRTKAENFLMLSNSEVKRAF